MGAGGWGQEIQHPLYLCPGKWGKMKGSLCKGIVAFNVRKEESSQRCFWEQGRRAEGTQVEGKWPAWVLSLEEAELEQEAVGLG